MQLLRHGAGGQPHGLQSVLLQGEVQRGRTHAPVGIHRAHHRTGIHDLLHVSRDFAQLVRIRASDPVGNWVRRIRAEYELGDTHARLGGKTVGDCLSQSVFQRLALVLAVRADHDLGKRRVRQLRSHREIEAWRALADVGCDDLGFLLFGQPVFHLRCGGTGLCDRRAIGHLHLDQHFGPVGDREELLLYQSHAEYGHDEKTDHRTGDQPLARDDALQHLAEAVVAWCVVERVVATFDLLEVGQQFDAQVGCENHGDHPRRDQCDANDPEHIAGVLPRSGSGEAIGHESDGRDQRAREHWRCGMAPGIGGGGDAAGALFHLHHHHFDCDYGVVHQQSQRQDQGSQGDAVEVLAGREQSVSLP